MTYLSADQTAPSDAYFSITPSDTVNFPGITRAIRVGTGGNISAVREDDVVVLFKNCYTGELLPIRAKRINATNTTASDLVGLA